MNLFDISFTLENTLRGFWYKKVVNLCPELISEWKSNLDWHSIKFRFIFRIHFFFVSFLDSELLRLVAFSELIPDTNLGHVFCTCAENVAQLLRFVSVYVVIFSIVTRFGRKFYRRNYFRIGIREFIISARRGRCESELMRHFSISPDDRQTNEPLYDLVAI